MDRDEKAPSVRVPRLLSSFDEHEARVSKEAACQRQRVWVPIWSQREKLETGFPNR